MWNELLYRPIYNALILIYDLLPYKDVGLAIIVVTILMRLLLLPLSWSATKSQRLMQSLAPELEKIKEKYKDNQQEMTKATMEFYKQHGINPLSSCLPLLIQLPILIALYQVLRNGLDHSQYELLYSFVPQPESFNQTFLGFIDLTKPFYPLAIVAGLAQFAQSYLMKPLAKKKKPAVEKKDDKQLFNAEDFTSAMSWQFTFMMPIMTVFIAWNLFAGLPLYWVTTTLFSVVQQYVTNKMYPIKNIVAADTAFHEHKTAEFKLEPELIETSKVKDVSVSVKRRNG